MSPRIVLNEKEMGEIALRYVKRIARKDSIRLDPQELRRQAGNTAKDLGISPEKALQFMVQVLDEVFKDVMIGLSK